MLGRKISILFFYVVILFWCTGCQRSEKLMIESPGQIEHSVALGSNRDFSLRYTHSVEKTPVFENFHVLDDGKFILKSTRYRSQGVGLPFLPLEGQLTVTQDGWFILEGLNREFQEIKLRVGPEAKLVLICDGREYPIYEWYPPGSLVLIRKGF